MNEPFATSDYYFASYLMLKGHALLGATPLKSNPERKRFVFNSSPDIQGLYEEWLTRQGEAGLISRYISKQKICRRLSKTPVE